MSKLDEIYRKRLGRIREALNLYIASHLTPENKISASDRESAPMEKKKGGVLDKFLNCMKLNDEEEDYFDADYLDEEVDECLSAPLQAPEAQMGKRLETRRPASSYIPQNSAAGVPAETVNIPDFLKRDRERTELDKVLEKKEESFSEMLFRMIDEKGLKDSDVYKSANIDRRLFSKIRAGEEYVPSRKTAISFCLALQLELEETGKLLATAGYTLSASSRFDLIIRYLIEMKEYNIHFANIVLNDYGEGTLSR